MKTKVLFLLLLITFGAFLSNLLSNTVGLAWDHSPDEIVRSYRVYYGTQHTNYTHTVDVGYTNFTPISNLIYNSVYYFSAKSLDAYWVESEFADELVYTNQAPQMTSVNFSKTDTGSAFSFQVTNSYGFRCVIEATTNLTNPNWFPVMTNTTPFSFSETNILACPQKFYRLYFF